MESDKSKVVGTYTITKEITAEQIENIVVDALEGGINYWGRVDTTTQGWELYDREEFPRSIIASNLLLDGRVIRIVDIEENDKKYGLTLDHLIKGIQQNATERPWDCDSEQYDADTVDAIFQLALFGEIVFG